MYIPVFSVCTYSTYVEWLKLKDVLPEVSEVELLQLGEVLVLVHHVQHGLLQAGQPLLQRGHLATQTTINSKYICFFSW